MFQVELTDYYTDVLQSALLDVIDPDAMVAYYEEHGTVPTHLDLTPLYAAVDTLYKDAYLAGYHVGAVQLQAAGAGEQVWAATADAVKYDWDTWVPGSPDAALLLQARAGGGAGLKSLLDQAGVTIKGMGDTTLDQIGTSLSESMAGGLSSTQAAKGIEDVLGDRSRAQLIAQTEMARAMTVATLDQYKSNGIGGKVWLLSDGACPLCEENDADGEVNIDDEFTNGDPPVHPYCVCAVAPVTGGQAGEGDDT